MPVQIASERFITSQVLHRERERKRDTCGGYLAGKKFQEGKKVSSSVESVGL